MTARDGVSYARIADRAGKVLFHYYKVNQNMEFDEYQANALLTDQKYSDDPDQNMMIPLLGMAGEAGSLLSEFKKKIRDKNSYEGFERKAKEELGDILWYISCIASRLNISLGEIAAENIIKTQERWPIDGSDAENQDFLDKDYPESEQLPRVMTIRIYEDSQTQKTKMFWIEGAIELGDPLTDNAYVDDGYRFHDVFHLAYMAVLGWSPVIRRILRRKRKSVPKTDEVEDGARAAIIEELITQFVYMNASERNFYENVKHVDTEMLFNIKSLISHLEVKSRKISLWEKAILQAYEVYRVLAKAKKKDIVVKIDMFKRELKIVK